MKIVISRTGLLLLAATPLLAQFSQLAATDDGKQLYFISPLVLYSSSPSQSAEPRLYRIGPDGVSQIAFVRNPFSGFSSGEGVSNPQVSGDGSLIGYTLQNVCDSTGACGPQAQLEYAGQIKPLGPGTLQLTRNGRWALLASVAFPSGTPVATLIDPVTNFAAQVPQPRISSYRIVASDGTVLVEGGLWRAGQITAIQFPSDLTYNPLALSDNAAIVISTAFTAGAAGSLRLAATNTDTARTVILSQATTSSLPYFMALSNDGSRALYRTTGLAGIAGAAFIADTSTGVSTLIALPAGELAIDGTLSGDGQVAFLVTTLGRIVKVSLATGGVEPLLPPTPYVTNLNEAAIGSLAHLQTTYPGSVSDWTGQLLLNGRPLPVLAVKPGEIDVQIPWEQPAGAAQFQVAIPTGSPFQQSQSVFVSPIAPAFELLDRGQSAIFPIKIINGDWSGLQTVQPQPGDIVNIYFTGLGPVAAPVSTGVPASLTAPDRTLNPLTCTFTPQTTPAETLFAGLAPGTIGLYQAAFRIRNDPNHDPFNGMSCTLGNLASFGFGFIMSSGFIPGGSIGGKR